MYSVAIRKRSDGDDFFWEHEDYIFQEIKINCEGRYWLADPFLLEKDGKVYIFYEAFDLIQRKGKIGYSIIDDKKKSIPIHIVLDEPYHLSFPNVFVYQDNIYMMPETCGDNSIKLFKAASFPEKWVEDQVIVPDIYACDSVIVQDDDKKYLIANEMYHGLEAPGGNYISCWVKNIRYKLNDALEVVGDGTLVAEGDCGIRNAGNFFRRDGKLYRVGQNCPNKLYGRGLVLFEVKSLNPYIEERLWIKDCSVFDRHIHKLQNYEIIGVHTYNFSTNYEVIDFSQIRDWKFVTRVINKGSLVFWKYKFSLHKIMKTLKNIRLFIQKKMMNDEFTISR